jgi:hypothetical protein
MVPQRVTVIIEGKREKAKGKKVEDTSKWDLKE